MDGRHGGAIAVILWLMLAGVSAAATPAAQAVAPGAAPAVALELVGRWGQGPVYSTAVSGNHVFFGSGGAIRVLEFDPGASRWLEVGAVDTTGVIRGLTVSGSHLYVADDSGALLIVDISTPHTPRKPGAWRSGSTSGRCSCKGRTPTWPRNGPGWSSSMSRIPPRRRW